MWYCEVCRGRDVKVRMRLLIHQQYHLGHHYHYVAHLLPALMGHVEDIVVAVTEQGRHSPEFDALLAPYSPNAMVGFTICPGGVH